MTALPIQGTVVTAGAGVVVNLDALGLPLFDLTGKMLRLSMLIDDVSKIGNLLFFVGTSSLVNSLKWRFDAETATSKLAKSGELFTLTLQLCEIDAAVGSITLSPTGVPSVTSGFTDARLQVSDNATGAITVKLFSAQILAPSITGGYVSVVFDDSNDSMVDLGFPRMAALGFAGTAYTIVDALGSAGRATLAELQEMHGAGWEIAGHALTDAAHAGGYTALSFAGADAELAGLRGWLVGNFPDEADEYSFSYPLGRYENTTDGVALETLVPGNGFTNARTILSSVGVITHTQVESLPPPMPYRLYGMSGISSLAGASQLNPTNLIAVGGMLDKVAANGGWMILVFHRIVTGTPASTTEISQADFNSIMAAIAARLLTVAPVREVLRLANTAPSLVPTAADVVFYLGESSDSWTVPEITEALTAETAAQARVCRVGAVYPADLREALLRRVQRNLALRGLPLAVLQGDPEAGSLVLPGRDPEVRRLEAGHRKVLVG